MIYHITTNTEWTLAKAAGVYEPESLQSDGYIHCVDAERFAQVANFYFKGRKDLIVLEINPDKLKSELRWEEVGSYVFPHIYGPLTTDMVERVAPLAVGESGLFSFPFERLLH